MILVSYADTKPSEGAPEGHVGTIYQSTNWVYTGTSTPFTDKVRGKMIERSSKHRYVFFLNATDKKLLQWQTFAYPKRPNNGTRGEKAHLKSVCRYEFLPYSERHGAPEVPPVAPTPVVSFDDASSTPAMGHTGLIGKLPLSGANGLPCEMEEL
ncbi:MAG: hypothetical protein WB762_28685 [Candidatus Sulfotelmatobacter sp.]